MTVASFDDATPPTSALANRPAGGRSRRRRAPRTGALTLGSGLGLGVGMIWFSLLVLIPLTAVVVKAQAGGWDAYWKTITNPQTWAAVKLTVEESLIVTLVNVVMGTLIAWVLVRDDFFGKRALEVVIDVPFALPTIVAGLVLLSLYGPRSPIGINVANTQKAVFLALAFVTVPFVVRTVQPVLENLGPEMEEAAGSLGAGRLRTFRAVIWPEIWPALATGFALAFARGVGEYGSVVFIAGNQPMRTEITPLLIITKLEQYDYAGATAIAVAMLVLSFAMLLAIGLLQRFARLRGV